MKNFGQESFKLISQEILGRNHNNLVIGKILAFLLIIILNAFGPIELYAQVRLQKVGKFQVQSLHTIAIADYNPTTGQYLAIEQGQKGFVIVLMSKDGEILLRKDVAGQGPGQISGALNGFGFSPEGGIWIMSLAHIVFYDMNMEFKKQLKFTSKIQLSMYGNANLIPYFTRNSQGSDLVFVTFPTGGRVFSNSQNIHSEYLLELFDAKKKENYQLVAIKERSVGTKLDNSLKIVYFPVFSFDNIENRAFVTGSIDNEITVVDTQTGKTINKIEINHGEFKSLKNAKLTLDNLPSSGIFTLTAINNRLLHLDGGLIVLNYVREIPEAVYERKKRDDRYYHHFQDPDYHRLIVFDQSKQLSGDIPVPKNGKLMIALPENRLLFKINDPEVEEDFVRYEIYQVVMN